MSEYDPNDQGTLLVLFKRFKEIRLPRAQDIKSRLDAGETINEFDIEFLKTVLEDGHHLLTIADQHPEIGPMVEEAFDLYEEITQEALFNEEKAHNLPENDVDFPEP